jgi:hypothetical protein
MGVKPDKNITDKNMVLIYTFVIVLFVVIGIGILL